VKQEKDNVPIEDAKEQVRKVCARLALLHISFSKVLVEELGEEKGTDLILKAIKKYGAYVGEDAKKRAIDRELSNTPENYVGDLPNYGMHDKIERFSEDNENRIRAHGCVMGKVWRELDEEKLGRYYCYVDPAKYMAFNPEYKLMHLKAMPDGDDYCEFAVRPTTEKEQHDFQAKGVDWRYIDR
jgi:hypothetical protein